MPNYDPGVTAFVLFDDCRPTLDRCLSSVQPVVDQIIAIDTGSTDGSEELAHRYTDKVLTIKWPESYAEAYNVALEQVQTEWTLWIEADEWLLDGQFLALRNAIQNPAAFGYELLRQDFVGGTHFATRSLLRLWRTHPKLRLTGHIHPQLRQKDLQSVAQGRTIHRLDLRLGHESRERDPVERLRRNLRYLERQLAETPTHLYFEMCYADTLYSLDDDRYRAVLAQMLDRLLGEPKPARSLALAVALQLETLAEDRLWSSKTERLIEFAWRHFSDSGPVLFALGLAQVRRGLILPAYHAFRHLNDLLGRGALDLTYPLPLETVTVGLPQNLELSRTLLGRDSERLTC